MIKFPWKISLKDPYVLAAPVLGITSFSGYETYKNLKFTPSIEHNYLARVQLTKDDGKGFIDGRKLSFTDRPQELQEVINEDIERLNGFYRKYGSKEIQVNNPQNTGDTVDFFIHMRSPNETRNINNLWLENVHLNQLSIDRYGYKYDSTTGNKHATETNASLHKIVDWKNIDLKTMSYKPFEKGALPHVSFNFWNTSISKDEVEILTNEDETKFKLEDTDKELSKDWFVWIDKPLLSLKLNYILQTYVFNEEQGKAEQSIKTIIGNEESNRNDEQKRKIEQSKSNYDNLSEIQKAFAKTYLETYVTKTGDNAGIDWNTAASKATTQEKFIKTDDLNKIYNRFKSDKKDLSIFNQHLVSRITAGPAGNWKVALNLEKDKEATEKKEEKKDEKKTEAREIKPLTESYTAQEEKDKNRIKIFVDADTNPLLKLEELHDLLTKYSVRYFDFNPQLSNISSTYSHTPADRNKEALHILDIRRNNEFGFYKQNYLIPLILSLLFVTGIVAYLVKAFKAPGLIFSAGIVAGLVNAAAVFFTLGSHLSLVGVAAFVVGIFYALLLIFYSLGFLKKLFDFAFLDKSNIFVSFKRTLIFASDLTLPLFIFSTFIAFLAPLHLREFGVILSLCLLIFFILIPLFCNWVVLRFAGSNFLKVKEQYVATKVKQDFLLNRCIGNFKNKSVLIGSGVFLFFVLVAGIVFSQAGFNSFSLMRDNYLVTFIVDGGSLAASKQLSDVEAAINDTIILQTIGESVGAKVFGLENLTARSFLVNGNFDIESLKNLLSTNLAESSYYIQQTRAFSDFLTIRNLSVAFGFSLLLMSLYIFIRFRFKNLLILLINNFASFAFLITFLLVFRVAVYSSIFVAMCTFFAFSIMYHICLFNIEKNSQMDWFAVMAADLRHIIYQLLQYSIAWFFFVSILTTSESLILINLYMTLAILVVHVVSTFTYFVLFDRFNYFMDRYLWKKDVVIEGYQEADNLDLYDEELIPGINRFR